MNRWDDTGAGRTGSDENEQRHRQVWELIPWVVNGRASAGERRMVEQHVAGCADCTEELGFQRQLQRAMLHDGGAAPDHAPALQRLWQRIDAGAALAPRPPRRIWPLALAAALALQTVGLGVLAAALWSRDAPSAGSAAYRTLSTPPPAAARATIRVVFAADLTERQMQALLAQSGLQIVGGPSDAGVFSLAPLAPAAAAPAQQVLQRLRASPGVRFAESLPLAGAGP
ncbi:MAG: zf-HC2 domain-containing protein [Nevskia sp.]|nr:zf-HC2 domain-containing protein [Nevskia sp.]